MDRERSSNSPCLEHSAGLVRGQMPAIFLPHSKSACLSLSRDLGSAHVADTQEVLIPEISAPALCNMRLWGMNERSDFEISEVGSSLLKSEPGCGHKNA